MTRIRSAKFCRPYIQYPFTQDTGWRWSGWRARDHVGRIYLTDTERQTARALVCPVEPFVLIEPSIPADSTRNKDWGLDRYQQVVDACPEILFVRALYGDLRQLTGVLQVPGLDFRETVAVLERAVAYVGAEGGLHHAAAAIGKPAVVVFGGCISVDALGYPQHVNIADTGSGSPCGTYVPCEHCRRAMAGIAVETVAAAVRELWEKHVVRRNTDTIAAHHGD